MMKNLMTAITLLCCFADLAVMGQEKLTPDQQHLLKAWREMGNEGEPPGFRKKFVKPEGPSVFRLVENSWSVIFTFEVTAQNLEKTSLRLARKYGMKVRQGSLDKGSFARMALFTGPEASARKLADDLLVRIVEQDARREKRFPDGKVWRAIPENQLLKITPPPPIKRPKPTGLWDKSAYDANGSLLRPQYRIEDVVSEKALLEYCRTGSVSKETNDLKFKRIQFKLGSTSTTINGMVTNAKPNNSYEYKLRVRDGQMITARLVSSEKNASFTLSLPGGLIMNDGKGNTVLKEWKGKAQTTGNAAIWIDHQGKKAAMPYTLTVSIR